MNQPHRDPALRLYCQHLLRYKSRAIPFFDLTARQWLATLGLFLFIMGLGVFVIINSSSYSWAGWMICGMGLGSILRDVGARRRGIKTWPYLSQVVDWPKIEALSSDSDGELSSALDSSHSEPGRE